MVVVVVVVVVVEVGLVVSREELSTTGPLLKKGLTHIHRQEKVVSISQLIHNQPPVVAAEVYVIQESA